MVAALLERVWLLKVLGRAEDALVISEQAVRLARMALPRARRKNLPHHHGRGMRPATQREDDSRGG